MSTLAQYDRARAALAEATKVEEILSIRDEMEHVRLYAKQIKNRELLIEATQFQLRTERKLGIVLEAARDAGQISEGRPKKGVENNPFPRVTLAEVGVDKNLANRARLTSSISEMAFEAMVEGVREKIAAGRGKIVEPVPINGARAIMGSRQEPDDSLDYFPTPPWATRALIERAFPATARADYLQLTVWEPACGEGHMADVLAEYFHKVYPTDIFDYGYGGEADFLDPDADAGADWIITNPPFGDKSEAFVLRALDLATVGVAMFVRLQWLETNGRYERIFRDHPPTLISFFAERVNLCKGRWEPEGSTATAYIWLIWVKGQPPQAPFWIPPGQREALTKPDDAERFTAHPVIRKDPTKVAQNIPENIPDSADSSANRTEPEPPAKPAATVDEKETAA